MAEWKNIEIGSFLKERKERFKPEEARELNLKRIEKITQHGEIFISDKPSNTNMILVKKGDLVLSGIGIAKGGGNSLNIYEGREDVLATIHYSSYIINKEIILEEFLKRFLLSPHFRELLKENSPNGIKAEIKPKHFLPIRLNLPDLNVQKQIVDTLKSIEQEVKQIKFSFIDNEVLLTKLRQLILSEAVQGKLVPQDSNDEPASILLEKIKKEKEKLIREKKIKKEKPSPPISEHEIPYELPKGWVWVRLIDLIALNKYAMKRGPFGGSLTKSMFVNEGYLVYEQRHAIHNDFKHARYYITSEKYKKMIMFKVEPGDLIVSCSGVTLGRISEVPANAKPGIINQALLKIQLNKSLTSNDFFIKYFNSSVFQDKIFEKAQGSAIPNMIGMSELKKVLIGLPPLNEQKRIVEKVDQLMKLCDKLEEQVKDNQKNSELLMESVLREAFEV